MNARTLHPFSDPFSQPTLETCLGRRPSHCPGGKLEAAGCLNLFDRPLRRICDLGLDGSQKPACTGKCGYWWQSDFCTDWLWHINLIGGATPWAIGMAVGLSILAMVVFDVLHAPAGALPLVIGVNHPEPVSFMVSLAISTVLLVLLGRIYGWLTAPKRPADSGTK